MFFLVAPLWLAMPTQARDPKQWSAKNDPGHSLDL